MLWLANVEAPATWRLEPAAAAMGGRGHDVCQVLPGFAGVFASRRSRRPGSCANLGLEWVGERQPGSHRARIVLPASLANHELLSRQRPLDAGDGARRVLRSQPSGDGVLAIVDVLNPRVGEQPGRPTRIAALDLH